MLDTAVEKVIAEIERLSSEQQKEVLEHLEKKVNGKHPSNAHITPKVIGVAPSKDYSKENEWLRQHRDEHTNEWVALEGDRLLAHGKNFEEVIEAARSGGVSNPLTVYIEPYTASPQLPIKPRIVATNLPIKDRSKENAWLALHRDEYAGQWVALDGDRLLGHGKRFKEVAKAADDAGVPDALIFIVEGSQSPPFAGF